MAAIQKIESGTGNPSWDTLESLSRALGLEIVSPFLIANSTYDAALTDQARADAAFKVAPVTFSVDKGQVIVRQGDAIDALVYERLKALHQKHHPRG